MPAGKTSLPEPCWHRSVSIWLNLNCVSIYFKLYLLKTPHASHQRRSWNRAACQPSTCPANHWWMPLHPSLDWKHHVCHRLLGMTMPPQVQQPHPFPPLKYYVKRLGGVVSGLWIGLRNKSSCCKQKMNRLEMNSTSFNFSWDEMEMRYEMIWYGDEISGDEISGD